MTTQDFLLRAKKKALESLCKYKVAAIGLNRRGEVLSVCSNQPRFDRLGGSKHAEMRVMLGSGKALKTILLCRVNSSGEFLGIKPCQTCANKAQELGVKIVCL